MYALIHNEYQGNAYPGQCPSGSYVNCWWNTITLAVSTNEGQSYSIAPQPRLVASVPYQYMPDWGTTGTMSPTNIVHNDKDGYYYAILYVTRQPGGRAPIYYGDCLIRTRTPPTRPRGAHGAAAPASTRHSSIRTDQTQRPTLTCARESPLFSSKQAPTRGTSSQEA